ncbi:WD40 repeat domain-containing protein [Nostoc sp.]
MWDLQTGKEIYTLVGDKRQVNCVAISPDGQNLVSSCGCDKTIKVWGLA